MEMDKVNAGKRGTSALGALSPKLGITLKTEIENNRDDAKDATITTCCENESSLRSPFG